MSEVAAHFHWKNFILIAKYQLFGGKNMCKMNINETKPRQNQSSHNF